MRNGAQRDDEEWRDTKGKAGQDDFDRNDTDREPTDEEPAGAGAAAAVDSETQRLSDTFDLQAHRGGRGERTEESRRAFENALDQNVTTLEFDIVLSADGVPVVWHDPEIQEEKCTETEPVKKDDAQFPYVGKLVHDLDFEKLQTLNCNGALEDFPDAQHENDNRLLQLSDVLDIAEQDDDVRFNIETKIEAADPDKSASPQEFVDAIVPELQKRDLTDRATIQSFDWRSLPLVKEADSAIDTVMLYDDSTWKPDSEWTGNVDFDAVDGDITEAAEELDADVLSPDYQLVDDALLDDAHTNNLPVIPWTANDEEDLNRLIDAGVDGIITDYPTRLREILNERDIEFRD